MAGRTPANRLPSMFPPAMPVTVPKVDEPWRWPPPDPRFAIHLYYTQAENDECPYYRMVEIANVLSLEDLTALCKTFEITDPQGVIYPLDYIRWVMELPE